MWAIDISEQIAPNVNDIVKRYFRSVLQNYNLLILINLLHHTNGIHVGSTGYPMEREDWQFVKVYTDEYNGKTIQLSGVSAPHKHKKTALRVDITPGAIFLRL